MEKAEYNNIIDTAKNLLAPGQRCTISSIITESINEVIINKYGEDWEKLDKLMLHCYSELRGKFSVETYKKDIPYFYSIYYLFLNIPKIQLVLIQLLKRRNIKKKIKILDVGCGVGTSFFAIIDLVALFDNISELFGVDKIFEKIEISFWDGSEDNLAVFRENRDYFIPKMKEYIDSKRFVLNEPVKLNITTDPLDEEDFDIIILSNILNEINFLNRKEVVEKISSNLSNDGYLIAIDPADENRSKHLNKLKYDIVKKNDLHPVLPCGVCDRCTDCWNYRSTNLVYNRFINYFDSIYKGKYGKDSYEEFFNKRLKWSYFVLSKNINGNNAQKLDDISTDYAEEISFDIVKRPISQKEEGIIYGICDGLSKEEYELEIADSQYYDLSFGDRIVVRNGRVRRNKHMNRICVEKDSSLLNIYEDTKNTEVLVSDTKEKPIQFFLKRLWGFNSFRNGQFPIIKRALENKETLGILPTGAGKSICYQLPSILKSGSSIVISPLKSLIKDQVDNLHNIGFEFVDYIDGSRSKEEKSQIIERFKKGFLKILYITPERLMNKSFQDELVRFLSNSSLDYFIIDEAHCASEWGHDFRPSYLKLRDISNRLNSPVVIAVTATASPVVRQDILNIFDLDEDSIVISETMDRPELSLEVIKTDKRMGKAEELVNALKNRIPGVLQANSIEEINKNGSGIIFTIYADPRGRNTRQFGTTFIKESISKFNPGVGESKIYHSGLDETSKIITQDEFKDNQFPILVATKGFGMGIDKQNIDYIIHMCFSNSLEAYYQEAGRAGRDGEHAHSVIISNTRAKKCIEDSNHRNFEPRCINMWTCFYNKGSIKCDYGAQAKFISDQYPNDFTIIEEVKEFLNILKIKSKNRKKFDIFINKEGNSRRNQSYLHYLQKADIINDYYIDSYDNNGGTIFSVELKESIENLDCSNISKSIAEKMEKFKRQRYAMLNSIWGYVNNDKICRKAFLMDYFKEKIDYGEGGCRFCDIEGINREKSIATRLDKRKERIIGNAEELLNKNLFDYNKIKKLLFEAREDGLLESIKIRAMRYLEDFPNSVNGCYFSGIITLLRNNKDQYGRNQIFNAVKILSEDGNKESINAIVKELLNIDEIFGLDIYYDFLFDINDYKTVKNVYLKLKTDESREILEKLFTCSKLDKFKKFYPGRND
jgi:RecQ family ATP-dependent DNA helicase